ncbi:nitrate- and nitrite sensing domain-containing protein [Streptomyces hebeiensis]
MRRSKTSSAEQQARGNFTPPPRAAAPPAAGSGPPGRAGRGGASDGTAPAGGKAAEGGATGGRPSGARPASGPRAGDAGPPAPGSSSRLSPRNWRVPTRLNAILLIPVLVGLIMGGFQVKSSVDTWQQAQDAESTALVVRAASEYAQAVLNERDLTAQPLLTNKRDAPVVAQARSATDAAKKQFDLVVRDMPADEGLERRLSLFRGEEPKLEAIRKTAYTAGVETPDKTGDNGGPVATEEGYVLVQHSLMEFANELQLGTGNITSYGRTVYAVQLAKAAESLQRSIGMHLLVRPSQKDDVRNGQAIAFSSYAYLEDIAIGEYLSAGTEADTVKLQDVMKRQAAEGAKKITAAEQQAAAAGQDFKAPPTQEGSVYDGMVAAIASGDSPEQLARRGVTPETWMAASTAKFDGYSVIEKDLVDRAVADAAQIADEARNDAITNGAVTVVALLAAFILAGMMARQMSNSMRSLRTAAFGVAEQRLPMLVDQLSRTEPGLVDTRVQPIPIDSRDEIGEVARAFDQVHREAVRLAAEQAMLRGNVNAIFTNLSRRNQSLIEGQLTLISDLENHEADPDQLENLFRLDHLATRMRRNGENLLVLAGEEPGRRWNEPVPLVDVLRAASSEVESYERIELSGVPETEIHGQAVTDLVHLLAELLENATTFSSPQTKVRVTATRLPDGRVMIEIHDKGIGLTAEDFADINHKLANPPTVDASVSQRMGLFVVGRLADRHGIRVQLRPSGEQAGTTSLVMLPDAITHGGGGEPAAQETDFTVSQITRDEPAGPAAELGFRPDAPMLTAADLGFDDSRYEQPVERTAEQPAIVDDVRPVPGGDEERAAPATPRQTGGPLFGDQVDGGYRAPAEGPYAPAGDQGGFGAASGPAAPTGAGPYGDGPAGPVGQVGSYQPQDTSFDAGFPPESPAGFPPAPATGAGYPAGGYAEAPYDGPQGAEQPYGDDFAAQPQQGGWNGRNAFQDPYGTGQRTEAESAEDAPGNGQDHVGFARPGPSPSSSHSLTDAGLPRRGAGRPQSQPWDATPAGQDSGSDGQSGGPVGAPLDPLGDEARGGASLFGGGPAGGTGLLDGGGRTGGGAATEDIGPADDGRTETAGTEDWQQRNDARWQRAEQLREPKAGGVTSSGLPRRVPKANLVEGAAEQSTKSGPQVSRSPEDVRGRLSNLLSGVQRGRNAGADTNGPGQGPGSTYNQER